jgi:hypothetical protein
MLVHFNTEERVKMNANDTWAAGLAFEHGWNDAVRDLRKNEAGVSRAITLAQFGHKPQKVGQIDHLYIAFYLAAYNTVERGYKSAYNGAQRVPGGFQAIDLPERFELPDGN